MHFLFVGPNVCRQLLSDSQSPTTPLLLANTPYCKAYSGLSPYSAYPCLTHIIKATNFLIASLRCSENRDRTCDLRVMSPTSYRCSISRYEVQMYGLRAYPPNLFFVKMKKYGKWEIITTLMAVLIPVFHL